MKPLSAVDAISPAFTRTHQLLFDRPLKFGRIWKLCVTSYLAVSGSIFIPFPLFFLFLPHDALHGLPHLFLLLMFIPFAVYLVSLYLCVRMEFVEFEMIVTLGRRIAPMWRRYGARAWPWLLTRIVLGTVICTAFAPVIVRQIRGWMTLPMQHAAPGTPVDPHQFALMFTNLIGIYAVFFAVLIVLKAASTLLGDFVLPFYAIENIPLAEACRKGWDVVRREPLHILGYLGLKLILTILGYILLQFAVLACMIPLFLVVFVAILAGAFLSHLVPGTAGHVLVAVGGILLGILGYGSFIAILFAATGYLMNLLSSYAIYFMGGRYTLLGNHLEPPPPSTPFTPPPVFPSREEDRDDDEGPSLPLNPALA